jgi:uncharacterized OsmC-like protein
MKTNESSAVARRQAPLRAAYRQNPADASVTKHARTRSDAGIDVFHGVVEPGEGYGVAWRYGIDRAVGGLHDAPNPGDMLCAALAACQDSAIRMVADLAGIALEEVDVRVEGTVDVRGSLAVDEAVPVGFASLHCKARVRAAPGTPARMVERVLAQAERSCINLATLRAGTDVKVAFQTTSAGKGSFEA